MSVPESADTTPVIPQLVTSEWRRAVKRSGLTKGAKMVLLELSERGFGHYHDRDNNLHAMTVVRLMAATGLSKRAVQYALRHGQEQGFLRLHRRGQNLTPLPQRFGHQQLFHLTMPVLQGCNFQHPCEPGNCTLISTYVANATEEATKSSGEERADPLRAVEPQNQDDVGTAPPVAAMYAALPIVVYALTRLAKIRTEQTMASEAFHHDQPLDLGIPELAWPKEATPQGCRDAWHHGWQERHPSAPDPTYVKRAMQKISQAAKDRTDLETWRNLWRAARDAGRAGVWNVDWYLEAPPAPRYGSRGNNYVDVMQQNHERTLGILDGTDVGVPRELG